MIVIDCSIFMASLLDDEQSHAAKKLVKRLASGEEQALAPGLFFIECTNVLITSVRRKRITPALLERYTQLLSHAPFIIDNTWDKTQVAQLALTEELSAYDAIYLHTALKHEIPLATNDKKLMKAAKRLGVWFGEKVS